MQYEILTIAARPTANPAIPWIYIGIKMKIESQAEFFILELILITVVNW